MLRLISTLTIIDAHAFKRFNIIEMLFAPYDRAMLDAHSLCGSWASCYTYNQTHRHRHTTGI